MINNHGYYSPSIVKMDTMVTITTVKLYIVGVVSDGNLQMMRVGWKVARKLPQTHRKVFSHCTTVLGAVRVRRATPFFARI